MTAHAKQTDLLGKRGVMPQCRALCRLFYQQSSSFRLGVEERMWPQAGIRMHAVRMLHCLDASG